MPALNSPTPGEAEVKRRGRQRLIGAITLVLLLVVFVPMVLDPEPRTQRPEPAIAIPSKDNAPPLPSPKPSAPAAAVKSPEAPAPVSASQPPVAKPAAVPAPAKAAEAKSPPPAAVAAPAALPKLEGFAVQVGAFKEDAKLAQAREKLKAAKVSHYTERLPSPSGDLTRLRAGPFPTREAADKAAAEVKRAGLDGRVVPLP